MIAQIRGTVIEKLQGSIIVDVHGVGYEVLVPTIDFDRSPLSEEVRLYTYFHVRENAQELFGFASLNAKRLFEKLISVSGVGPKVAMSVMGLGDEKRISSAIAGGNIAFITGAPGVGKRVAEKITVELRGKVEDFAVSTDAQGAEGDDAVDALVVLGYPKNLSVSVLAEIETELTTQERVRRALKEISGK